MSPGMKRGGARDLVVQVLKRGRNRSRGALPLIPAANFRGGQRQARIDESARAMVLNSRAS